MNIPSKRLGPRLFEISKTADAAQMRDALQDQGVAILDRALEVFCNSGRSLKEGKDAVDDLIDLKRSLSEHIKQHKNARDAAVARVESELQAAKSQLRAAGTTKLSDEDPGLPDDTGTYRLCRKEELRWDSVRESQLRDVSRFIADLSAIQGLYAAVTMVPGPLGVSVKTLPKFSQESSRESHTSLESNKRATSVGIPLFKRVQESTKLQQDVLETAETTTATADEKVVPCLMELKERLMTSDVSSPQSIAFEGRQFYTEYREYLESREPDTPWALLLNFFSSDVPPEHRETSQVTFARGTYVRKIAEVTGEPAALRIPTSGITS
jgi:hypothetical protein